ncbi:MAG: hypothetical protein WBL80_05865 [Erysipelotrichaceae bacterium]
MATMVKYIYPILIVLVVVFFVYMLSRLRKATTLELERTLYAKNDPGLYLSLLANPRLRLLYRKTTLLLFSLNAQLLKGDDDAIVTTLNTLQSAPLTRGEKLEYLSKKLSYFCEKQNAIEAGNALAGIESILKKPKPNQTIILQECRLIYSIYIDHDMKVLKSLESSLQLQRDPEKILTYYRIAKLRYFAGDKKAARENLLLAKNIQSQSAWSSIAAMAYDDLTILERK